MLRLENIKKNYYVADTTVEALKGINLNFRKNEFVSILGPSGCGKTTLLNIIGGLDQYTSGDLVINGRSTKEFDGHDWDVYRNHRIGFIFQSYNLIPHQTVLGNVELALTIAGVSKAERVERAKKALDRVGLSNQYYKRPNQLSGGQCQRVAIARALVNEPEILLADEPTGALDTETSIQIMDLVKEIAEERLVIMVTHNPDLAYKYSTRIVKCLDGNVLEDSNPFTKEEEIKELEESKAKEEKEVEVQDEKSLKKKEKAKMSLWTAFRLSARNLYSKFRRTLMVALAGCIGIVGVSTVLAVSNGVSNYISGMENDMLSGNPVAISSASLDYSSLMGGGLMNGQDNINSKNDKSQIYVKSLVRTLYNMNGVTSTNTITKEYMDFLADMPKEATALTQYDYGYQIAPNLFTDFETAEGVTHKMSVAAIQSTYASVLKNVEEFKDYASMISSVTTMSECPSDAEYIGSQYDIIYAAKNKDGKPYTLEDVFNDETALIAVASQAGNTLNDLELAEYGYFSQNQFLNYAYKVGKSKLYDETKDSIPDTVSYEDLCKKEFTWYPNDTVFHTDGTLTELGVKYYAYAYSDGYLNDKQSSIYDNYKTLAFDSEGSVDLNVKVVLKLKKNRSYGCLTAGGLYYTNGLTNHIREYNKDSQISKAASEQNGSLYNIEVGYEFRFDNNSVPSMDTNYLSGSSSAIMEYISQFMGASSGLNISSYSLEALGGAEYPKTIAFFTYDFEQKDLLTSYLDKWNDGENGHIYKMNGDYYVVSKKDESGEDYDTYYFYDEDTNSYYLANLNAAGYATDNDGKQYKLINEDGVYSYQERLADTLGNTFYIDGAIKLGALDINAYTFASKILLGEQYEGDSLTAVENTGGYLWHFINEAGNKTYVVRMQNQSYYKMSTDMAGNIVSSNNGYKTYHYDEDEKAFYLDSYTYDSVTDSYKKTSKKVKQSDIPTLYYDGVKESYLNVQKNPEIKFGEIYFTIDTKGLYVDINDVLALSEEDLKIDFINHVVTLKDYSKVNLYYKDIEDTGYSYYYAKAQEIKNEDGTYSYYLISSNMSLYGQMFDLFGLGDYAANKYYIKSNGELAAVEENFSSEKISISSAIEMGLLGETLSDTSLLATDDSLKVKYTDMIGLIISMVNTLINVITYALIAFTALSLIVSTVMIGIITYVSVVERIKEIGVIRALGGRKKDVSHLFNAETLIIGFSAGVLGIGITYLLSVVINLIIGHFSGIYTIAALPWYQAIIMILISVFLTMVAGLIPASSAAKKDPVVALRTE